MPKVQAVAAVDILVFLTPAFHMRILYSLRARAAAAAAVIIQVVRPMVVRAAHQAAPQALLVLVAVEALAQVRAAHKSLADPRVVATMDPRQQEPMAQL